MSCFAVFKSFTLGSRRIILYSTIQFHRSNSFRHFCLRNPPAVWIDNRYFFNNLCSLKSSSSPTIYQSVLNRNITSMSNNVDQSDIIGENHSAKQFNGKSKWRAEQLIKSKILKNIIEIDYVQKSNVSKLKDMQTVCVFVSTEQLKKEFECLKFLNFAQNESLKLNPSQLNDFNAEAKSHLVLYPSNSSIERIILIGIGDESKFNLCLLRSVVYKSVSIFRSLKIKSAHILSPYIKNIQSDVIIDSMTRISVLSNHIFDKYITLKPKYHVEKLIFLGDLDRENAFEIIKNAQTIAECTSLARELVNDRGDIVTPQYMEDLSISLLETHSDVLKLKIIEHDELLNLGLNMITAVGQGAKHKARIIVFEYNGAKNENAERIALVGKGITFDTGGLNLKPTNAIEDMYMDMHGSATVFATMKALAILKPSANVVGVLCVAENSIDALSIKPHTIVHTAKGSVLINNTDAEGRLALGDGFTYVQNKYSNISEIIDVATLTGACTIALGEHMAGVFSNDDQQVNEIIKIGDLYGEKCWRLPATQEYEEELKDHYADFKSTSGKRLGGASVASCFLKKFINPSVKWTHIDIAGPGMHSSGHEWIPKGGTGFGVQLLTAYCLRNERRIKT